MGKLTKAEIELQEYSCQIESDKIIQRIKELDAALENIPLIKSAQIAALNNLCKHIVKDREKIQRYQSAIGYASSEVSEYKLPFWQTCSKETPEKKGSIPLIDELNQLSAKLHNRIEELQQKLMLLERSEAMLSRPTLRS